MKRSQVGNRPYARKRRTLAQAGAQAGSQAGVPGTGVSPGRLADRAGLAARPSVEHLEPRQLLFSLTITEDSVDPNLGIGTVTATFAYGIPYLLPGQDLPDPAPDEIVLEDFTDEAAALPQNVVNGRVFNDSKLVAFHSITPASDFQLQFEGGDDETAARLRARLQNGESFTFRVSDIEGQAGPFRAVRNMQIDIGAAVGGNVGLDVNNMRVVLLFGGEVLASFTGAELAALNPNGTGVGTFDFAVPGGPGGGAELFDAIRFEAIAGENNEAFFVDNVQFALPDVAGTAALVESRIFGARVTFSGPVGASAQFLDLFGREMIATLAAGVPEDGTVPLSDRDGNGVMEFNDGIGQIIINGSNFLTSLTMVGGTIEIQNGAFVFVLADSFAGLFSEFEAAGFGYALTTEDDPSPRGLPPGPGSVIIGSPFLRAEDNVGGVAGPYGSFDFNRPDQGVFVNGGSNMGTVTIHGVVHGSSEFTGAVNQVNFGYFVGSLTVAGDMGALVVGSDAATWSPDVDTNVAAANTLNITGGQVIVERTAGEIAIGGRSLLSVTVIGDLNDQAAHPPRDVFRYFEKEAPYAIPTDNEEGAVLAAMLANTPGHAIDIINSADGSVFGNVGARRGQGGMLGLGTFRNDTFSTAEWIGSIATAVQVYGELGYGDPVNTGEDGSDVYAFASDGSQPILLTIQRNIATAFSLRLLDASGRTVAAGQFQDIVLGAQGQIRFDDVQAGMYTVVISTAGDGDVTTGSEYLLTVSGMASTTFGAYRSGGGSGDYRVPVDHNFINVLSGNIGALRIGTGLVTGDGAEASAAEVTNSLTEDQEAAMFALQGMSISTPGSLFGIFAGGDIGTSFGNATTDISVGGDFGWLITGQSPVNGVNPEQGDLLLFNLTVGGRIAGLDIRGAVGIDQDPDPDGEFGPDTVTVRTGANGGAGDIGIIRVGGHIAGDSFRVTATPGSVIGAFLVSQDIDFDPTNPRIGIYDGFQQGMPITTGIGADVRFVDFPRLDNENSINAGDTLTPGQFIDMVDDSGGRVRIQLVGGTGGVFVRSLAIDGSQGKAIATIDADLSGDGQLLITYIGNVLGDVSGVVSIGKINITNASANSRVSLVSALGAVGEIDVWQIVQTGGDRFGLIENTTTSGDIVAIDVAGLDRLRITGAGGSLGRTQVPEWGPRLLGPFLGIAAGGGAVGGTLPVPGPGALMDDDFNGVLYRPAELSAVEDGQAFMDDIGGPVSPFLNGIAVRAGNLAEVTVAGSIGDIVVAQGSLGYRQDGFGDVGVVANSDGVTAQGRFDGIVGVIYSTGDIGIIRIGDGLAARTQSPIPTTGIFANDDIFQIIGDRPGSFISGNIIAGNQLVADGDLNGIQSITLTGGGSYVGAWISSSLLDASWRGSLSFEDQRVIPSGDIALISGTNADFIRSEVHAGSLQTFELVGGDFDASVINAADSVGLIRAVAFRNSTLAGSDLEFHLNQIIVGGDVGTIQTALDAGDMNDLRIDILGSITGRLSAMNFNRVQVEVDNTIFLLDVGANMRASSINTGRLVTATIEEDLVSSRVSVSGLLESLTAENIRNARIEVTGPSGRIIRVAAAGLFSGSVAASGPIGTLESTGGDLILSVTTTTAQGDVALLRAARDLDITTSIAGNLSAISAGRHVGNRLTPGVILVRGNLENADISGGQLYSDLRIGGALTGVVTIGRASSKPGSTELGRGSVVAFGRLNAVVVNGDFNGSIISHSGGIGSVTINNGSFFDGNLIAAFDGDLSVLTINAGHLFGDVHADFVLGLLILNASADGVFGDIGINPSLSAAVGADDFRNQLPIGSTITGAVQGPTISAGHRIGQITLTNGSIFEATIWAGRAVGAINVNGDISNDPATTGPGTVIAAGDLVFALNVTGSVSDALVLAGVTGFGADGRAGGTGDNADTIKAGRVRLVNITGNATNVAIAAGMTAGVDGTYNSAGARHALGLSYVQTVTIGGAVTNVSAFADSGLTSATAGVTIGGRNTPVVGGVLEPVLIDRDGNGVPIWGQLGTVLAAGVAFDFGAGTITYTGPGTVVWDSAGNRLLLLNTTLATDVTITSADGTLEDFDIVSNDDAMAGVISILASLSGDSDIIVDGFVREIHAGNFSGTGSIIVGNDLQLLDLDSFTGGSVSAIFVRRIDILGNSGGVITITGSEGVTIGGDFTGTVSLDRSLRGDFVVGGVMRLAEFRTGGSVGNITASALDRAWISARDSIGNVTVAGDVFDSSIMAGADLGRDGAFGGEGASADSATSGSIGNVAVGGNFAESDVVAGALRGADGFFGTADDSIADGRSTIGNVSIGGTLVGSNLGSESYRIFSTGSIGSTTLAGQPLTEQGNFRVVRAGTQPLAIQVTDLRVTETSRVYTARIFFNQPMDASSIGPALGVFEVRGESGEVTIRLIEGLDYTLTYEPGLNAARIVFSKDVTRRDLPQVPGQPGPGIYRFTLDSDILRAAVIGARLDGNGDGFARGEDYAANDIVGDAGDKLVAEQIVVTNPFNGEVTSVDIYAPINLNIVLDSTFSPDGLADANRPFTIRGSIGDHPDNDTNNFRFASDLDVYKVTLQAGQILRLGPSSGSVLLNELPSTFAGFDNLSLYDAGGQSVGAPGTNASFLPAQGDNDLLATTFGRNFLIRATGDYFLVVSGPAGVNGLFNQPGELANITGQAGEVGSYNFTFEIFDDLNSGFASETDSGDGEIVPIAPPPADFAGPDGQLGTPDDLVSITSGSSTFTLDDSGNVVTTIRSAIGEAGFAGVPGLLAPDIDVFHLSGGQAIPDGTRMRITVRLTDLGSDLGSRVDGRSGGRDVLPVRYAGEVQFGLFDTTSSASLEDGRLVFAPTDFAPSGGTPGIIASDGSTTYGYDQAGDFFLEFVANGESDGSSKYAVYVQGVFNTDYDVEVVTLGSAAVPAPQSQNVFLEVNGGTIDWLQASGLLTDLDGFDTSILGFTGSINGVDVDQYVLSRVVTSLNNVFAAAGLAVTVSTNPVDFEHEDFSTVFISNSPDPLNFFNAGIFGYSERSDALNADRNDEAVVFVQPMASLGYTPSQADIDTFSDSLTAAVGRRIGELLGLRIAAPQASAEVVDIMAANSVSATPDGNGVYRFSTFDRALSARFDAINTTDFYLGNQNAQSLLDRLLGQ